MHWSLCSFSYQGLLLFPFPGRPITILWGYSDVYSLCIIRVRKRVAFGHQNAYTRVKGVKRVKAGPRNCELSISTGLWKYQRVSCFVLASDPRLLLYKGHYYCFYLSLFSILLISLFTNKLLTSLQTQLSVLAFGIQSLLRVVYVLELALLSSQLSSVCLCLMDFATRS
jgi:hypothetical protein